MAIRYKRLGRRTSLRQNRLQQILRGIILFFLRIKRAFQALRPGGRILALCICGGVVLGAILIAVLPGKPGSTDLGSTDAIVMRSGAAPAAGSDPSTVLALPPTPSPSPTLAPTPTPDLTLKVGVEDSERVTELQNRLMELGYLDIDEPTLHFGPATKYAVELFQRQHGLQMDGIAGTQTLEMIYEPNAKKYTMIEALSGNDVENFQQQLKDLGYLKKVTGYYGTETVDAVKAFQKENKLSVDGKAGEKTLEMINSDKAKPSPDTVAEKRRKANIDTMIATAKKQLGVKYILGRTGPSAFDCSGLVYYCLKQAGSNRLRLNAAGYSKVSDWENITSYSKLKKGDLLFFYDNAKTRIGHVGIYIGSGEMVDASSANGKVVRRSCTTNYWKSHFVNARRPW